LRRGTECKRKGSGRLGMVWTVDGIDDGDRTIATHRDTKRRRDEG
jgi:hypothetical protein